VLGRARGTFGVGTAMARQGGNGGDPFDPGIGKLPPTGRDRRMERGIVGNSHNAL
jgi:hypothetical protein